MSDLTSCELDSLPVPLDFGPVLKTATQTGSKRSSKRSGANGKSGRKGCHVVEQDSPALVMKHTAVKHLYACERCHRWQWVPDRRLADLWHGLSREEQGRIVKTHEQDQLTPSFRQELDEQVRAVECYASQNAKNTLASMIWCDQSGLALFKRIFIVAVEQNHPMVIDMEVIAAVDAVIQDFCATVMKMKQSTRLPGSVTFGTMLFVVMMFWIAASGWTWMVALLAMSVGIHNVCRSLPHLDPRNFTLGSDLWVQYREREHIRLMWMSATVRVFEVRLIRILERRRRAVRQAEALRRPKPALPGSTAPASSRAVGECTDGPVREEVAKKKYLGQRRLMRRRRGTATSEEGDDRGASEKDTPPTGRRFEEAEVVEDSMSTAADEPCEEEPLLDDSPETPAYGSRCCTAGEAVQEAPLDAVPEASQMSALQAAWYAEDDDEEGEVHNEEGDEIDAEFARRVQEHFQIRVHQADKDLHSQTARGNQILKTLCQKLKTELERPTGPA
mmetsp:Transcript_75032/g.243905  ORF Transcript_75032/g.243905 Transcript_75032/m.243905 type:complete len:503 (+) Transcript_75032:260-1768(+)